MNIYDNDPELCFLTRVIKDRDLGTAELRDIQPKFFTDTDYASVYQFILDHKAEYGVVPDIITVQDKYPDIVKLINRVRAEEPINYYIDTLIKNYTVYTMNQKLLELVPKLSTDTTLETARQLKDVISELESLDSGINVTTHAKHGPSRWEHYTSNPTYGVEIPWKTLQNVMNGWQPGEFVVIVARPGQGKALDLNTRIYTDRGIIPIKDLKPDCEVVGKDGKFHKIKGIYDWEDRQMYKVLFDDGTEVRCDEEHLWYTQTYREFKNSKEGKPRTVKDIIKTLTVGTNYNHHIPMSEPVEFYGYANAIPNVYSFYCIGHLFNNAHRKLSGFYRLYKPTKQMVRMFANEKFTTFERVEYDPERDILDVWCTWLDEYLENKCNLVNFSGSLKYNAYIDEYFIYHSTKEQRLDFIKGVLDGNFKDGNKVYLPETKFTFSLIDTLRSLGYWVKFYKFTRESGMDTTYIQIKIKDSDIENNSFYMLHPIDYKPSRGSVNTKKIISITPDGKDSARCISVDTKDSLFLIEGYTLTHNTHMLIRLAIHAWLADEQRVLCISPELPAMQFFLRMDAQYLKCSYDLFKKRKLDEIEKAQYESYLLKHPRGNEMIVVDATGRKKLTVGGVATLIKHYKPTIVFIDSLYMLRPNAKLRDGAADWEVIGKLAPEIKQDLGLRFMIPIIAASQFGRNVGTQASGKKNTNVTGGMEDVAYGDRLNHYADAMFGISRGLEDIQNETITMTAFKGREIKDGLSFKISFDFTKMNFDEVDPKDLIKVSEDDEGNRVSSGW